MAGEGVGHVDGVGESLRCASADVARAETAGRRRSPLRTHEARALGRLGVQAYGGAVSHIEKAHLALSSLSFRSVPIVGPPLRSVHDSIARFAYRAARGTGTVAASALVEVVPWALAGSDAAPVGSSGRSSHLQAALNAALGDKLTDAHNPLAIHLALRCDGRDVPVDSDSLRRVFAAPTSKLAVFVHGLGETDDSWRLNCGPDGQTYGARLSAELGYTPVYLRYNTGRHVSHSGRELSELLAELVARWPAEVDELVLVGHSMGGLVIRSAAHYGEEVAAAWTCLVRHIFYLGSPHLGAPLARWTQLPARAAAKSRDTLPFAPLLTTRSAGVDDLRFGYLVDEDWAGCDTERCTTDHRHDVELLGSATHHAVSATVTRSVASPVGGLVGDLLVRPASAHGRRRKTHADAVAIENRDELGGRHHFHLLNDPDVYEVIRRGITGAAGRPGVGPGSGARSRVSPTAT